jgi:hypothetical protein
MEASSIQSRKPNAASFSGKSTGFTAGTELEAAGIAAGDKFTIWLEIIELNR